MGNLSPADIRLPRLRPTLKLFQNPQSSTSGEPTWSLHDPIANSYYRLNWPEFECLARFARADNVAALLEFIRHETTLNIDENDVYRLISFLQKNGLVVLGDQGQTTPQPKDKKLWQTLVSNYLYFFIPLCKPDAFLKRTLPLVNPLLGRPFFYAMMALFAVMGFQTLMNWDVFAHTFTGLFSAEGAVQIALTFAFVKIIHELGHAYTAVRNGVAVPHLGIAFIVMYPVLYTETTGAWQLPNHRSRREIALAGIRAEMCLAALALTLWHMAPAGGTLQTLCFLVVTVALVSSLLVNLNPFMRFDGYYILSDTLGLENLQHRACDFARWKLRHVLFGLADEPPELLPRATHNFMTWFGFALIVYRFFLFLGIALLVYHLFFEPLGAVLFLVEISVFIVLPIYGELKKWWQMRDAIRQRRRAKLSFAVFTLLCLALFLPLKHDVTMPGVLSVADNYAVYPPAPARVKDVFVKNGDRVRAGDRLVEMESSELERDYVLALNELEKQNALRRRSTDAATGDALNQIAAATDNSAAIEQKIADIKSKQTQLILTAPFDGMVRDMPAAMKPDIFVNETILMMRVVNSANTIATAYATEGQLPHLAPGQTGIFRADGNVFSDLPLTVTHISETNSDSLSYPVLASTYGGPIAAEQSLTEMQKIVPRQSLYQLRLEAPKGIQNLPQTSIRGTIEVSGIPHSPLMNIWVAITDKFMRK